MLRLKLAIGDIFGDDGFSGRRCFGWEHFGRDFVRVHVHVEKDGLFWVTFRVVWTVLRSGLFLGPVL